MCSSKICVIGWSLISITAGLGMKWKDSERANGEWHRGDGQKADASESFAELKSIVTLLEVLRVLAAIGAGIPAGVWNPKRRTTAPAGLT